MIQIPIFIIATELVCVLGRQDVESNIQNFRKQSLDSLNTIPSTLTGFFKTGYWQVLYRDIKTADLKWKIKFQIS